MTDIQDTDIDELALLKERAKTLNIKHHPSIGLDKLRDKVEGVLNSQMKPYAAEVDKAEYIAMPESERLPREPVKQPPKAETKGQKAARLRKEAAKLIRVRVANMNPSKKDWEGEVYTVSNSIVGTFKKYVPFNNEEGWHIPYIIYQHLKEKECQIFVTAKGPKGNKIRKGKIIRELNIEVLDPLTPKEVQDLVKKQAMAGTID